MTAKTISEGVNFLPSWRNATDPSDSPAFRVCDEDGTHHFSHVKKLDDSGKQYIHAVNSDFEPTRAMLIGTGVHHIVLGKRPGSKVVRFPGEKRVGAEWKAFAAKRVGSDILTIPEWDEAEEIATAVLCDPVAQEHLVGARFEVPLTWEDGGVKCSTSGVDIIQGEKKRIGDLKTTNTTQIEKWQRQAFSFSYHAQMCWYRRGCIANGIDVSGGMFLLGVDIKPPFEVVVLEMTEDLIDLGEKTISLWLEKLRVFKESNQWPGRAQSAVPWGVPAWMREDDDDE